MKAIEVTCNLDGLAHVERHMAGIHGSELKRWLPNLTNTRYKVDGKLFNILYTFTFLLLFFLFTCFFSTGGQKEWNVDKTLSSTFCRNYTCCLFSDENFKLFTIWCLSLFYLDLLINFCIKLSKKSIKL